MATVVKNALHSVRLACPTTEFSSATGNIWIAEMILEGRAARGPIKIYCDFVPTPAHFALFNDGTAPCNGSELIDMTTGDTWQMESGTFDAHIT